MISIICRKQIVKYLVKRINLGLMMLAMKPFLEQEIHLYMNEIFEETSFHLTLIISRAAFCVGRISLVSCYDYLCGMNAIASSV